VHQAVELFERVDRISRAPWHSAHEWSPMSKGEFETLEALSRGALFRGEHGYYQEGSPRLHAPEAITEIVREGLAEFDGDLGPNGAVRITRAGREALKRHTL
jgi:hypothetical protein